MPQFSEQFLQELSERNDIVDVVSGYVQLTKRSGSNLFGLCPFHSEKTPSFSVSPDKQIYHCFGCGKGGSVIGFIMEIENLSFPDAVGFLARRAGMAMPEENDHGESKRRERMLHLNRDAARFFHEQLKTPAGQTARDYIARRGLSSRTVTNFGLGFAPNTWSSLTDAMKQKGYSERELFEAGLVRQGKSGRGVYDTFRNRLMFPVIDVRGNVIGFSGRILDDGEPKYMNSPETLVFSKSHNLFALNLAKKSKSGYLILAEGNIDVASLHQAGFDSAVASLGTSLTDAQARLMSRYVSEVVIAYDNDGAGQKAAQRAIAILEKLDVRVRVLRMEGAKDPDEYIAKFGPDAFRNLLEKSENHVEYRLDSLKANFDLTSDEQKVAFLKEAADIVAQLPGAVEREVYAMRLSEQTGVPKDAVEDEIRRRRKQRARREHKEVQRTESRPVRVAEEPLKGVRIQDTEAAAAERNLIQFLCHDPALFRTREPPDAALFVTPEFRHIYEVLSERAKRGESLDPAVLTGELSSVEFGMLTTMLNAPTELSNSEKALEDCIYILRKKQHGSGNDTDLSALQKQMIEKKGYGG